ncbi:hypothetical protein DFH09DRAFT_1083518 [Mycena vulgaris]|nr:hypothetical protein DFH09DRAFT_1083518 [Mycena vulgaris]
MYKASRTYTIAPGPLTAIQAPVADPMSFPMPHGRPQTTERGEKVDLEQSASKKLQTLLILPWAIQRDGVEFLKNLIPKFRNQDNRSALVNHGLQEVNTVLRDKTSVPYTTFEWKMWLRKPLRPQPDPSEQWLERKINEEDG